MYTVKNCNSNGGEAFIYKIYFKFMHTASPP